MRRKRIEPYTIRLEAIDAASDGRAVARAEDRVVFIKQAVPGDILEVKIIGKEKKALLGKILSIEQASTDRVAPVCPHFGICGGCKWQMMRYEAQLRYKEKQVIDAFERIAKVPVGERLPILGAPEPYGYRNKLEFTFSDRAWLTQGLIGSTEPVEHRVLGFHVPSVFDKILDIDTCKLHQDIQDNIRNAIRDEARKKGFSFYNIKNNSGFLRNLLFRSAIYQNALMTVLIVAEDRKEEIEYLMQFLASTFPEISDLGWILNDKRNSSFSELSMNVWSGKDHIIEKMGDYLFRISPTSFFQTNPRQALRLYDIVKSWAQALLPSGEHAHKQIWDLYSGTGSIGIYLSELAEKIVGIEYVETAVQDAWKNVHLNNLSQFQFYAGDIKNILGPELLEKEGKPDLIVCDPPRAGMDPKVIARLLEIGAQHLIYVSCQPGTQARDIALLNASYDVVRIQAVDMFPQTAHVENIALLKKRNEL